MNTMATAEDAESLSERQENELEVLKAIYVDDVSDLRDGDAWKVSGSNYTEEVSIMVSEFTCVRNTC